MLDLIQPICQEFIKRQSINSYISDQRTVLAKKLLKDPTIKIQKIAEMTGMRTASYFTHYFKKYVGISPQEYRNQ